VVFLACMHLALFLALSFSPGNSLVCSWCDLKLTVVITSYHYGCLGLVASAAGNGNASQKHSTPASRYVTVREIEAMTTHSAAVRRLFDVKCTDNNVNNILIRTGKV